MNRNLEVELHTIYSEIAQRGRGSTLYLDVRALKQEEDWLQRGAVDWSDICSSTINACSTP